jgi:hypothetical protein
LPLVLGFWAVGEDFFPDSRVFLLGKIFFANSSGLGCWESSGLLAKSQFPVVPLYYPLSLFSSKIQCSMHHFTAMSPRRKALTVAKIMVFVMVGAAYRLVKITSI